MVSRISRQEVMVSEIVASINHLTAIFILSII
jgi:hypothetical protein